MGSRQTVFEKTLSFFLLFEIFRFFKNRLFVFPTKTSASSSMCSGFISPNFRKKKT